MRVDRPIATAIIFFVILLLAFFLVFPEYGTFKELRTELAEKKAEFNAEFDYYAEITKRYYELQNREEDIKKVDDALPEDSNLGKLVYFFQKNASENGMIIKDLFLSKNSPVKSKSGSTINEIVFSMDIMGNYDSLGAFLSSLERSDRIFEVVSISFGSANRTPLEALQARFVELQSYAFNLQIKTHSY